MARRFVHVEVEGDVEIEIRERGVQTIAVRVRAHRIRRDRERGLLTLEAYETIGGVRGALARHAEATLDRIGPNRVPIAREIFRNLVTAQGTRAGLATSELLSVFKAEHESVASAEVLSHLTDARLLTTFDIGLHDEESREHAQFVEIAHEVLITAWPRLVRCNPA